MMNDLISRQAAMAFPLSWEHRDKEHGSDEFISGVECYRDYIEALPSARQDRSLWFRIGEICVDESKGFISGGRAVEKIRELLREAEPYEGEES